MHREILPQYKREYKLLKEHTSHTEDYLYATEYLQGEERSSLQHDGEQKTLHACLCHLQSEFYKRTLFVVYVISVQDLMPAMPSHHTNETQRLNYLRSYTRISEFHPELKLSEIAHVLPSWITNAAGSAGICLINGIVQGKYS